MSEKWYFSEDQLANSPSRKCGINSEMELSYRQRAANLIQEMGQRLQVSQLCINTAIVYMHRFYAFHSFTMFHRNSIAAAAFFLAAKVEEQPRKLEHVIKILNICLEKQETMRDSYAEQAQELVFNENILLQTLGFDVAIDHPHTHVVKACQLFNIVTVSRELRQTCYFMASNSLHLTTMCLKYRPTVVAAFCIYIACKWSRWEIPDSSEGKSWYSYVDESVTLDTLKKLTDEYLQILERSPSKFKSKMKAITSNGQTGMNQTPSFSGEAATTSRHNNHQHHHHHHHRNSSAASSTATSSMNANGNSRNPSSSSSSSSSAKAQMHQMSNSQAYKQQVPSQQQQSGAPIPVVSASSSSSSTSTHLHRPRTSSSASSQQQQQQQQQQLYGSSNSSTQQAKLEERQQRMMHAENAQSYYSSSSAAAQRISDHSKHRMSSSSSSQQQQQQQVPQQHLQPQYLKSSVNDQKQHNVMMNNAKQQPPLPAQTQNPPYPMEMHQKSMSRSSGSNSSSSNNNSSMPPTHISQSQKKLPWMQQQQMQQQQQQHYQNQDKMHYQHLQKSLQMSNANTMLDPSASNLMNMSKSNMSGYSEMKHMQQQQPPLPPQQQQSSNSSQNDFWFNDKINEITTKTATPPNRQAKSLFSPSPEQDSSEKSKYMMMTGSLKREKVDSPKEDRKSLTPSKRDKLVHGIQKLNSASLPQTILSASMQKDSKNFSKLDSGSTVNMDAFDPNSLKKRSYSSVKDSMDHSRDTKVRKVDVKLEPIAANLIPLPLPSPQATNMRGTVKQEPQLPQTANLDQSSSNVTTKQPIETNPDIVKSLLKECFATSSKFDAYDTDSPLDVINPELPDELMETPMTNQISHHSQQVKREAHDSHLDSSSKRSDDRLDSSAGESRKDHKKKSKKKKEKHKHKKKHKSSDREDRGSDSLKMTLSKDKRDSKSSPESGHTSFNNLGGGLKIKIPMKDVGKPDASSMSNQQPAPIKLKISKEKFSSFNLNNNNNNNNSTSAMSSSSTSSSSHKKKDKDRDKSKSKSSKHSSSSDLKESGSTDR